MWRLDGPLRYIPIAALHDGDQYLAEKYRNVIFTRSDFGRLLKDVKPKWTGLGFGTSNPYKVDLLGDGKIESFSPLPEVRKEMDSIFGTANSGTGVLDGDVFLNNSATQPFTKKNFLRALKKKHPVIHVASHFLFHPGNSALSYLLLGDGSVLTLNEMRKYKNLFEGVDLLTLSACETAVTRPDAYGKEIDGFAELAQRLGAGAVMASLWKVNDASTAKFMKTFYESREQGNGITKAAALQKAQLSLLHGNSANGGKANKDTEKLGAQDIGGEDEDIGGGARQLYVRNEPRRFKTTRDRPYAHPYYWAPFVLYGNWK